MLYKVCLSAGETMDGEKEKPIYLGVDVAGASNTWAAALSAGDGELEIVYGPRKATLQEIVDYCEKKNVVAATIDAQLTIAISEENGFRTSDDCLRDMIMERNGSREWVSSINSLMGVPVRGRMLADHLSPTVGTLLETHPRASLLFALGEKYLPAIREYKRKRGDTREQTEMRAELTRILWQQWSQNWPDHFNIAYDGTVSHDGELDSLVCATVAYLYHHAPNALYRLRHDVQEKTGRGPFYVLVPDGSDSRNA